MSEEGEGVGEVEWKARPELALWAWAALVMVEERNGEVDL